MADRASRYATRFLGDRALAEDAAQDALVTLFGQLDRFDRERDALTWALAHRDVGVPHARAAASQRRAEAAATVDPSGRRARRRSRSASSSAPRSPRSRRSPPRDIEIITAALIDDDELRRALAPATFRKRLERALGRLRTSWRSRHGTL